MNLIEGRRLSTDFAAVLGVVCLLPGYCMQPVIAGLFNPPPSFFNKRSLARLVAIVQSLTMFPCRQLLI